MALLSLRAYARHRGVSLAAVQKAIKSGRITPTPEGLIDSDRADVDWSSKTQPSHHRLRPARSAPVAPAAVASPAVAREPVETSNTNGLDYFRARAIREGYLARLAKIEFEERSGKLVSRDEVQVAAFTRARVVRDNLLNIPDRVAATVAAETDPNKVHSILSDEIRRALEALADGHSD